VKVSRALRCPAAKFITHTLSHFSFLISIFSFLISIFSFLILLAAATFRLDDRSHVITSTPRLFNSSYEDDDDEDVSRLQEDVNNALKDTFRPANILFTHVQTSLFTHVQICLMFWVFGTTVYLFEHAAHQFSSVAMFLLPSHRFSRS